MWYQVKLVVDEAGQKFSRRHVDLALADLVVGEVIQANRQNIECWRIHRRYGPQEFKVDVFCPNQASAQNIQDAISSHPFVGELRAPATAIVTDVQCNPGPGPKEDIGEPGWPQEFRHVWPDFALGQSEMLLNMVQFLRSNSTGSPTVADILAEPLNDRLQFYRSIQNQIDSSWGQQGSHALIHHMHSFFGYAPFQSNLMTTLVIHDIR